PSRAASRVASARDASAAIAFSSGSDVTASGLACPVFRSSIPPGLPVLALRTPAELTPTSSQSTWKLPQTQAHCRSRRPAPAAPPQPCPSVRLRRRTHPKSRCPRSTRSPGHSSTRCQRTEVHSCPASPPALPDRLPTESSIPPGCCEYPYASLLKRSHRPLSS